MNLLQRMFPKWAVERAKAHITLQRLIEHDKTAARHPRRKMGPHSGDAVMQNSRYKTRESARWLEENHAAGVSIIETLVTNIIGEGTVVEPMVMRKDGSLAAETNAALRKAWRDWMRSPEVTGDYRGCEFESQIVRSWVRDGEIFGQNVFNGSFYTFPTDLKYAVELIEADLVPFDVPSERDFIHGVRKNTWGKPVEYLLYMEHPGSVGVSAMSFGKTKVVSADLIWHLKWTTRIRQTRGVSILHAVIDTLLDLADYEDSERVAARLNAAQVFWHKSGYAPPETLNADGRSDFSVAPGSIWHLQNNEEVGAIRADRPNPNLDPFVNSQLRRVAGGSLTSYSSISRNYNGTYSSQRQELVETQRLYKRLQRIYYDEVLEMLYRNVVNEALRVRDIPVTKIDQSTLFNVDMRGPGLIWIDPLKDAKGAEVDFLNGFRSRQQIIRERGGDPVHITKELNDDDYAPRQAQAAAGGIGNPASGDLPPDGAGDGSGDPAADGEDLSAAA